MRPSRRRRSRPFSDQVKYPLCNSNRGFAVTVAVRRVSYNESSAIFLNSFFPSFSSPQCHGGSSLFASSSTINARLFCLESKYRDCCATISQLPPSSSSSSSSPFKNLLIKLITYPARRYGEPCLLHPVRCCSSSCCWLILSSLLLLQTVTPFHQTPNVLSFSANLDRRIESVA